MRVRRESKKGMRRWKGRKDSEPMPKSAAAAPCRCPALTSSISVCTSRLICSSAPRPAGPPLRSTQPPPAALSGERRRGMERKFSVLCHFGVSVQEAGGNKKEDGVMAP